jgi:hypothetical protein
MASITNSSCSDLAALRFYFTVAHSTGGYMHDQSSKRQNRRTTWSLLHADYPLRNLLMNVAKPEADNLKMLLLWLRDDGADIADTDNEKSHWLKEEVYEEIILPICKIIASTGEQECSYTKLRNVQPESSYWKLAAGDKKIPRRRWVHFSSVPVPYPHQLFHKMSLVRFTSWFHLESVAKLLCDNPLICPASL